MQTTTLWEDILDDPRFQGLPHKIETTEEGQIILSPHKPRHGRLQSRLSQLLMEHLEGGAAAVGFAVETPKGVKAPDVVWMSNERWDAFPEDAAASPLMPEIAIEVVSSGNTSRELEEKRRLYFEGGALEVWIVTAEGQVTFFVAEGQVEASHLAPAFPRSVNA